MGRLAALTGLDVGKTNVKPVTNVENQDRAKGGENETGGMKSSAGGTRKDVGNGTADDRSDNAEHDCPENRHVHVHDRFRDHARDQPNNNVPK